MPRGLALRLFLTIWAIHLVHFNPIHAGAARFVYLADALVSHHGIRLDPVQTPYDNADILEFDGHRYCNTNPGVSFLAAPVWLLGRTALDWAGARQFLDDPVARFFIAHLLAAAFVSAALTALAAVVLAALVRIRTGSLARGLLAATLYGLGTIVFHFSTHLNQNVVIAALSVLAFAAVFEPEAIGLGRRAQAIAIGVLLGAGVFVDLSIGPYALVLGAVLAIRWKSRPADLTVAAVAALVPIAALAVYLWQAFGRPFTPPQAYYPIEGQTGIWALMTRFDWHRLADQIVLPGHGLIPSMPFTALALWYLPGRFWRAMASRPHERLVVAATVGLYVLYVWANASAVNSQFGPRYLIPAVPFLVLAFAVAVPDRHRVLAGVLVTSSLLVNWAGAMMWWGTQHVFKTLGLLVTHGLWLPVVEWSSSAEVRALGWWPELRSASGIFVLLLFALAAIWGGYVRRLNLPDSGT